MADVVSVCPVPTKMLWNWYTMDACFISEGWHVTTRGGFAVSCLGATGMVLVFEFLRRLVKEYDIWLVRKRVIAAQGGPRTVGGGDAAAGDGSGNNGNNNHARTNKMLATGYFRPTRSEQAIRALLYTMQVIVGYFIMLYGLYTLDTLHPKAPGVTDKKTGWQCTTTASSSCAFSLGYTWVAS